MRRKEEDEIETNNHCFGDGTSEREEDLERKKRTQAETLHLLIMS